MQVVHSRRHLAHTYDHEIVMGRATPAWEVPARAEVIAAALVEDGHELRPPDEHGVEPILTVHDAAMVRYLETAWSEWSMHGGHNGPIVPDTFLVARYRDAMGPVDPSASPCGRVGHWCFDTMTPIVEGTYDAARAAVDVAITAAQLVRDGATAAYGLCRPPGHHAATAMFGGYCYFNNAAIAAHGLARGTGASVGILDVDVHHGNGTQAIFYERADVAYASLHGDPDRMFPYHSGYAGERGAGAGSGTTFNQPLPADTGDEAYLAALQRAIDMVLDRTDGPIVVSLGLDTYERDPIGDLRLTTDGYAVCGGLVASAGRPLVILQEGGYDVPTLGRNAAAWLAGVEGRAHR
jgi:acetoin utilization deacetylase AcuC-like enzyme